MLLIYINLKKSAALQTEILSNIYKWINFENRNKHESTTNEGTTMEFRVDTPYVFISVLND